MGLINDDFEVGMGPDAVWTTLDERRTVAFPDHLIEIGVTGDGGVYAIDCSRRNSDGECPVVEWWYGFTPEQTTVAEDFGAFIWQCLQESASE